MSHARACCCDNQGCIGDCIVGNTVDTGCCHKADTLVLWNKRPSYTIRQQYAFNGCETCYTLSQSSMSPVQSIYKYHSCRFRFVYAGANGPIDLVNMGPANLPTSDADVFGIGEGCANPICEPAYCPDVCCSITGIDPGNCLCDAWYGAGIGGLSAWRRAKVAESPEYLWFVEMTCHKSGSQLDATDSIPRLASGWLCNVFFERWWLIARDCDPDVRIYVPGCTQTISGGDCGGVSFTSSNLVPKWWIHACSGIPLYDWELDEAVELGVITSSERAEITNAINAGNQPPQPPLFKMAKSGYLVAKDWRQEQRQAYIDLDARFPGAGYGACVQNLVDMDELGPFRKRYTKSTPTASQRPYLHNDDVISELDPYQAYCSLKDYPGLATSASDYEYWRERQWVYFRGIPGGWAWAGWNSASGTGYTEEEAIARGLGRNVGLGDPVNVIGAPLEAFRGEPRPPATCANCNGVNPVCPGNTLCNSCAGACTSCGSAPVAGCDPPTECRKFSLTPTCEGIRFLYSVYVYENDLSPDPNDENSCISSGAYKCYYQAESFLTEAKRTMDSWDESIPFKCRTETPPLGAYNSWPGVERAHLGPTPMCNEIVNPADPNNPMYDETDLCCSGHCTDFEYIDFDWPEEDDCPTITPGGGSDYPCPINGPSNPCDPTDECPPHGTTAQTSCIGHSIQCVTGGP